MIAIQVDTNKNIKIVNITPKDLNDYEGYAPIIPDYNISIFVKNFDDDDDDRKLELNEIATDIYKSLIFGSVYITLEPDYKSDDDERTDETKIKELTILYYEELKIKYT